MAPVLFLFRSLSKVFRLLNCGSLNSNRICHKIETEVSDLLCKFLFGYLNVIRTASMTHQVTKYSRVTYLLVRPLRKIGSWHELLKCNCAGGG